MLQASSCDAERQATCRLGGKTCEEDLPSEGYSINTINHSVGFYVAVTPTLSLSISLPSSVFLLLSARGIWSCHSDNVRQPTRKQTEQKAFRLLMTDAKMFYFFLFGGDK